MPGRKLPLILFASAFAVMIGGDADAAPGDEPTLFSPGPIEAAAPTDVAPAFSPDGKTVFFGRRQAGGTVSLFMAKRSGQGWSTPAAASFSGSYNDLEPAFDPHGHYLIFASSRPIVAGGEALVGRWSNIDHPHGGGNLWRIDPRRRDAIPTRLPEQINANGSTFSPAIAGDGSLWFMRADDGNHFHIFRSALRGGQYQSPQPAPFTDPLYGDFDPAVAPDESFIIFSSSSKRSGTPGDPVTDLYISFRTRQDWTRPLDLRTAISPRVRGVEARLSPDLRMLYFSNAIGPPGQTTPSASYIWQVPLDLPRLRAMSRQVPPAAS